MIVARALIERAVNERSLVALRRGRCLVAVHYFRELEEPTLAAPVVDQLLAEACWSREAARGGRELLLAFRDPANPPELIEDPAARRELLDGEWQSYCEHLEQLAKLRKIVGRSYLQLVEMDEDRQLLWIRDHCEGGAEFRERVMRCRELSGRSVDHELLARLRASFERARVELEKAHFYRSLGSEGGTSA